MTADGKADRVAGSLQEAGRGCEIGKTGVFGVATANIATAHQKPRSQEVLAPQFDPEESRPQDFVWDGTAETACENVPEHAASQSEQIPDGEIAATMLGLFASVSRVIADDYRHKERQFRSRIDRKLRRMIQKQKEAIGLKSEGS